MYVHPPNKKRCRLCSRFWSIPKSFLWFQQHTYHDTICCQHPISPKEPPCSRPNRDLSMRPGGWKLSWKRVAKSCKDDSYYPLVIEDNDGTSPFSMGKPTKFRLGIFKFASCCFFFQRVVHMVNSDHDSISWDSPDPHELPMAPRNQGPHFASRRSCWRSGPRSASPVSNTGLPGASPEAEDSKNRLVSWWLVKKRMDLE